jgi:AraC-like DNA-binding protein
MSHICTIQARAVGKIISAVADAGVAPGELLQAVQLDRVSFEQAEYRIPYASYVALYEYAAKLTGDDCFGLHIAERAVPQMFDLLGYVGMASLTMGEALERMVRYYELWSDGAVYDLMTGGAKARLTYKIRDARLRECRHECESSFATPVMLCHKLTGVDWVPDEIGFHHPRPANTSEHERIFRAPVSFDRPANEMIFDRSYLDLPLTGGDQGLASVLDRHASLLLAELPKPGRLTDEVRRLLGDSLKGGGPGLDVLTRRLGMTGRTLQRKLKEEGATYQNLVDEVRCELSKRYLQKSGMAIGEIAYSVGFSETSAFNRAFKRWTGMTPKEYRRMPG